MKLFTRPKCFSEAIALVTSISCLLGLRIFEYPRGQPRPILSLIYSLLICSLCYSDIFYLEKTYNANLKLMKLEYILYKIFSYLTIVSTILKLFMGWLHTKKFKVCYKKIFEIDETLRQLGLSVNYDRIYFMTIGKIIFFFIFFFIMGIVAFIHFKRHIDSFTSIIIIVAYIYLLSVDVINVLEFYIFVKCLQIKFKLINQLLCESLTKLSTKKSKLGIFELKDYAKIMNVERKRILSKNMMFRFYRQSQINVFVSKKQDSIVSQIKSEFFPSHFKKQLQNKLRNRSRRDNSVTKCQEHKHLLRILKQVHLELCKVSKIICTIFGVQIALEIGEIITILTGVLYNFYVRYIVQHNIKGSTAETTILLAICFLSILKAIPLSRICKNATDEGNRTIEIIYAIYGCDADSDMQEEIQQFGIQILQSPVTFTVFGLTMNNRVLSMILITVTNYLVIMVQVSNALESNTAIQV